LLCGYKFSDLVTQYNELGFIDIHRTCTVNLQYVFSVGDVEIHLDDGIVLPLSRRKRKKILEKFLKIVCEVTKC